jgi:hypothetical protein
MAKRFTKDKLPFTSEESEKYFSDFFMQVEKKLPLTSAIETRTKEYRLDIISLICGVRLLQISNAFWPYLHYTFRVLKFELCNNVV